MRTLLRHALTGQYYQSSGKWTTKRDQAYDFRYIDQAVRFARQTKCPNMEVDLSFDPDNEAPGLCFKDFFCLADREEERVSKKMARRNGHTRLPTPV